MYQLLWFFFVYAFLGWCAEVAYAALLHGRFINRGFLNGPVCPIYGFGVLLALFLLRPLQPYWFALFLGSVILTSLLELATGFCLEKIFGQRWWDYSKEPFNLGGYICLRFSLLWGFACVFVVDILHPTVALFVAILPRLLGVLLLLLSCVSMAIDLTATVRSIAKLRDRQSQIDDIAARMRALSNEFGESLSVRVLDAAEVGGEIRQDLSERAETFREQAEQHAETFRAEAEQRAETFRAEAEQRAETFRAEAEQRAETFRAEAEQRAETFREQAERARETREERLRKAQWEVSELRARLAQLRDKPVSGQGRLARAFPKIADVLHESTKP